MLRLLTRRRCSSCGDELPPPREYPMRVCATCILAPTRNALAASRPGAVPGPDWEGQAVWLGEPGDIA